MSAAAAATRWVLPFAAGSRERVDLLGGKGANLAELARLGVPVPPGFVITTEACRAYLDGGELPERLMEQVLAALDELARELGRAFGDPAAPLLVSVRSGAPVSMPGMMETILNVGLGEQTLDGFAAVVGDRAVALDCLARLTRMYAAAVGEDAELPREPHVQLEHAIAAVFRSWNSRRAQLYRRYHGIADAGTAVVVQAMVLGNAGPRSGTGVVFTRDPSTGERRLFGDYLPQAQGEDVVAGSHNTDDLDGMRRVVPEAYAQLVDTAATIERHFGDMCELEFTVEHGRLWLLQSRSGQRSARASVRIAVQLAQEQAITRAEAVGRVDATALDGLLHAQLDRDRLAPDAVLTTGVGSSPGLATGAAVFDSARAVELAGHGRPVVLVRAETRPDDLEGMLAASGLLTTRGGKTSHAAVVARGLGRPCVCGAASIAIDAEAPALRVGDVTVHEGETISLDGESGLVLRGAAPLTTASPPPEAATLLAWSDELRDLRVDGLATSAPDVGAALAAGADGVVLRLGAALEDPGALVRDALDAAGGRPLALWFAAPAGEGIPATSLTAALRAAAEAGAAQPLEAIVPASAVQAASAAASAAGLALDARVGAGAGEAAAGDAALVSWSAGEAPPAASDAATSPAAARRVAPPDLVPASLAAARALGAGRLVVPADRVAVARLVLAQGQGS